MGESREQVDDVDDLIAHAAGGDFARPADDERRAKRGLHGGEIGATPRTTVALPGMSGLRAVVAGEDDDRVVFDAGLFDRVEDLAGAIVHLGEAIGPIAVAGLARELGIRQGRHVNQRERDVGEKRLARARVFLDELDGARGDFLFHGPPVIEVEFGDLAGLFTLARFIDGLGGNQVRVPALLRADRRPDGMGVVQRRPKNFAVGARDAVPLVEAAIGGKACFGAAEVPLAPDPGGVALRREELRQRNLPEPSILPERRLSEPGGFRSEWENGRSSARNARECTGPRRRQSGSYRVRARIWLASPTVSADNPVVPPSE